jgi:S-adenosyl-L-methionine hydrolase (adenosine-forming)
MNPSGVIAFLSDFGLQDTYVGIVKGVILGINSRARIVDITHQIPHGALTEAAFALLDAYPFFPKGTVHLAVVDPGVGTARRPIAVQAGHCFFVGPDNGLFWPFIERYPSSRVVHLKEHQYFRSEISATFHGRDIFAPVAAHLSAGLAFHLLGPSVNNPTALALPLPELRDNTLVGQVIRVDHFGNLITNIDERTLKHFLGSDEAVIQAGKLRVCGIGKTYGEAAPGQAIALMGSAGLLELAVCLGRAGGLTGLGAENLIGVTVAVTRGGGGV